MCLPVGNYRQEVHLLYFDRRRGWYMGNKSLNNVFVGREACQCNIQYRWRMFGQWSSSRAANSL